MPGGVTWGSRGSESPARSGQVPLLQSEGEGLLGPWLRPDWSMQTKKRWVLVRALQGPSLWGAPREPLGDTEKAFLEGFRGSHLGRSHLLVTLWAVISGLSGSGKQLASVLQTPCPHRRDAWWQWCGVIQLNSHSIHPLTSQYSPYLRVAALCN